MLYVFSVGDFILIIFIIFLYVAINNLINRHYYTKHIRKLEKAVKELKKYGYTTIDTD